MIDPKELLQRVSREITNSLVTDPGNLGIYCTMCFAGRTVTVPSFIINKGWIIGEEGNPPYFDKDLSPEEVLEKNIQGLKKYVSSIRETFLNWHQYIKEIPMVIIHLEVLPSGSLICGVFAPNIYSNAAAVPED